MTAIVPINQIEAFIAANSSRMVVTKDWFNLARELAPDLDVSIQILAKSGERWKIGSRFVGEAGRTTYSGIVREGEVFISMWGQKRSQLIDSVESTFVANKERKS